MQANYYKLCKAIINGDFEAAKHLTNFLFSVNFTTVKSENPLRYAVHFDQIQIAEFLLKRGANPNQRQNFNQKPILTQAILKRNLKMAKLLIRLKTDVNFVTFSGKWTSLYEAASFAYSYGEEVMRLLLDKGAEVNALSKYNEDYQSALYNA